jgi:acetyl-CoA carboxylase carboxyl transferase subunit beta
LAPGFIELHGDRLYGDDPALIAGLGEVGEVPCVFLCQERGRTAQERIERNDGQMHPEGYRKATRIIRLAAQLRLPIITLIDTPGAALDYASEERGLASSISVCLATLSVAPVPVVSAIIGEGGSGGALALGVADRILMMENAIYSVIAPEGAAAILYRSAAHAHDLAGSLKLTAYDCLQLGVVDAVVPEPAGGAQNDPKYAARQLHNHVSAALGELGTLTARRLVDGRYRKFRAMGKQSTQERAALTQEVDELKRQLGRAVEGMRDRLPFAAGRVASQEPPAEESASAEPRAGADPVND